MNMQTLEIISTVVLAWGIFAIPLFGWALLFVCTEGFLQHHVGPATAFLGALLLLLPQLGILYCGPVWIWGVLCWLGNVVKKWYGFFTLERG
jgi:hypothetical protein